MNNPNRAAEESEITTINEKFALRVYLCAFILCLLSAIPWLCVSALQAKVYEGIPVSPIVWLLLSFFLLSVLSWTPQTPITQWFRWSLVLGCVFFTTLHHSYYVAILPVWSVAAAMAASLALLFKVHLFGAKAPRVLLPNLICTLVVLLLGSIALFALLMLGIFTRETRYFLSSTVVVFLMALLMAFVQATYIWGRLEQVPYWELIICSFVVYMNFWILAQCLEVFFHPAEFYSP